MKDIVLYAKKIRKAYKSYISQNGIDEVSEEIYNMIQKIESLDITDREYLDKFIEDNTIQKQHLADVTCLGEHGEETMINSLNRMRPFKLSETDGRIYEGRENSFNFVKQNSKVKSIKVYQKVYPKTA